MRPLRNRKSRTAWCLRTAAGVAAYRDRPRAHCANRGARTTTALFICVDALLNNNFCPSQDFDASTHANVVRFDLLPAGISVGSTFDFAAT